MSSLRVNYVQQPVMRFYSYFFDQFLVALLMTDPYKDPKEDLELQKKRQTIKQDFVKVFTDFQQTVETCDMDIVINQVHISINDRHSTNQYISITSD